MTKLKIAVMPKGTKHQFWQSVKAGADKAGEEEHVEVLWVGPQNETDTTEQVNSRSDAGHEQGQRNSPRSSRQDGSRTAAQGSHGQGNSRRDDRFRRRR